MRGIVGLARALGHQTVAEGVEDERTLGMMRALGVDYAQGFYVGRPSRRTRRRRGATALSVGCRRTRRAARA